MMQCQINNSMENRDRKEIMYVCYSHMVSRPHKSMDLSMKYKSTELVEENVSEYLCELRSQ